MELSKEEIAGVTFIKVANDKGLEVTFCSHGAAVYSIRFNDLPMTIAPMDKERYTKINYYGKTIGRINGRVKEGKLTYRGKTYQMPINENGNCLHSGKTLGFAYQIFDYKVEEKDEGTHVIFHYFSKAGECGLPGNLNLEVDYTLYREKDVLRVDYRATSDEATPLALTNHLYYNIGGTEDVLEQKLTLKASKMEDMDPVLLPLGEIEVTPVTDFRKGKKIGQDIKDPSLDKPALHGGYDHIFFFDEGEGPKAILEGEKAIMELETSFPGAVCYSTNKPDPDLLLDNGHIEVPHAAMTIEWVEKPGDYENMSVEPGKIFTRYAQLSFKAK